MRRATTMIPGNDATVSVVYPMGYDWWCVSDVIYQMCRKYNSYAYDCK